MRSTVRPSWHVILTAALLVALAAAPLAAAPLVAPAQAADQSLVFEALQVLQTHYCKRHEGAQRRGGRPTGATVGGRYRR